MAIIVKSKWLAANIDNPDLVIIDARGNIPPALDTSRTPGHLALKW